MYSVTTQQIEAFLTIAKYKNISRASGTMYISQPALSKILQRFEERLGILLFKRENHRISLSPEGEYMYQQLEPLYRNLNEVFDTARSISQPPEKRCRFVVSSAYDAVDIFNETKDYIARFAEAHPDIELTELVFEYIEIRNALEFSTADIAIAYDFVLEQMKNISYRRITEFPLYLAMSVKHPLAQYEELPPMDLLANEVFFRVSCLDEESALSNYRLECSQVGFALKECVFVPNMQTLYRAITEQKGMSICIKFSSFGASDEIKYYLLPQLKRKNHVVAAWRTDRLTPEARLFINMLPGDIVVC